MLLVLLVSIVLQISLNLLSSSITWMEELQWYLYGASAMVALSYTMTKNGHVRVELIHRKLSLRTRQALEVIWIVVALIPLYLVTLVHGWDFMVESFKIGEGSPDPGGMPYRWVVKAFIPIAQFAVDPDRHPPGHTDLGKTRIVGGNGVDSWRLREFCC